MMHGEVVGSAGHIGKSSPSAQKHST
jgi:hypothetical protein